MKQTSITETPCSSDLDEAPNMSGADFDRANFRVAGMPASRAQWAEAVRSHLGKQRVNMMLDKAIVEYFKTLAGERGYQTLINETLRRAMEARGLEVNLRQIIREELGAVHS